MNFSRHVHEKLTLGEGRGYARTANTVVGEHNAAPSIQYRVSKTHIRGNAAVLRCYQLASSTRPSTPPA